MDAQARRISGGVIGSGTGRRPALFPERRAASAGALLAGDLKRAFPGLDLPISL